MESERLIKVPWNMQNDENFKTDRITQVKLKLEN